jgi:integrase
MTDEPVNEARSNVPQFQVDLKTVSERLGHSSIAITADVYTMVAEQKQREASERLAEAFGIGKK